MTRIFPLAALALAMLAPLPAAAQTAAMEGEKVNQVIVYGNDACPQATGDEIVVCPRLPEAERFRVPEIFRENPNAPANEAWGQKVLAIERNGRFGTDSCSPVGLGGFTGCVGQLVNNAALERRAEDRISWSALIAEERAKRIAGIDDAAREVEAAVVAEERRMAEAQRRAAEAEERGGAPVEGDPNNEPLPQPK